MTQRTVHVSISGRVQGVGFRDWVAGEAHARALSGWVRNRRDGSVEAVFAGDEEAVLAMITACRQGPPMAGVDDVVTEEAVETPAPGFRILPTT
jgi:acylphosphatase